MIVWAWKPRWVSGYFRRVGGCLKAQQRRTGVEALGPEIALGLFGFVSRLATSGVRGNQSGRNYHPDERKANQQIVHVCFSFGFVPPAAGLPCPRLNHHPDQESDKSHKERGYRDAGVITLTQRCYYLPLKGEVLRSKTGQSGMEDCMCGQHAFMPAG